METRSSKPSRAKSVERGSAGRKPVCTKSMQMAKTNVKDDQGNNNARECDKENCNSNQRKGPPNPLTLQRLALPAHSKIEVLRESIKYPCAGVPKTYLPAWPLLPLHSKLPSIPAPPGVLNYSRGNVGLSLVRHPKTFSLSDPWNRERIPLPDYNALHDRATRNYLLKPSIRKFLQNQGLINSLGEVICSHADFNRFRLYLSSLHSDELTSVLQGLDHHWFNERKLLTRIQEYQNKTEKSSTQYQRCLRIERAKQFKEASQTAMISRFKVKEAADNARFSEFLREKVCEAWYRRFMNFHRQQDAAERRRKVRECQMNRRNQWIHSICQKNEDAEERYRSQRCLEQLSKRQFLIDQLNAKQAYQSDTIPLQEQLRCDRDNELKKKAAVRQRRVERQRELIPCSILRKRNYEKHLWEIVRKYFNKWRRIVRSRRRPEIDPLHDSIFDPTKQLEWTTEFLCRKSGYAHMDDFFLNIIALKEQIRQTLAEDLRREQSAEKLKQDQLRSGKKDEKAEEDEELREGAREEELERQREKEKEDKLAEKTRRLEEKEREKMEKEMIEEKEQLHRMWQTRVGDERRVSDDSRAARKSDDGDPTSLPVNFRMQASGHPHIPRKESDGSDISPGEHQARENLERNVSLSRRVESDEKQADPPPAEPEVVEEKVTETPSFKMS